jgi:glutathione S-transferase
VLTALHELKLEFSLVPVELMTGEHKKPDFMAKQPFGQIPVLEDVDGTLVYESRAIIRYLALKYNANNPSLYPIKDIKAFGLVEQWCSVECSNYDPSISGLCVEDYFKPTFYKSVGDPELVKNHRAKVGPILDVYEAHLAKKKYLTGDNFTLADLFHLPYGFYTFVNTKNGDLLETRPHLKAWFNSLVARDSWKKASA